MRGNQFYFDEADEYFYRVYYFWGVVYLLVLISVTLSFWSNKKDFLESNSLISNKNRKRKFIRVSCVIAWIIFFWLTYKFSPIEMEWTEFDPFTKMGISKESSMSDIRKAYKILSLKYHPDKGGDPKRFIRLSELYEALLNKCSLNNCQKYTKPIKPTVTRFGFTLPKLISDKKNPVWLLDAFLMIILSSVIYLLLKCVLRIFTKSRKTAFVANFTVKGQILINDHPIGLINLSKDVIVKRCSFHNNDMIGILAQFLAILHHSTTIHVPQWEKIKYRMELEKFDVRSFPGLRSPMMQLPLFKESMFRYFITRKRNVPSIKQLVEMKEKYCRNLLKPSSDNQYRDLNNVCTSVQLECAVMNEKYPTRTPSITVTAQIIRKPTVFLLPEGRSSINSKLSNQDLLWFSDDQRNGAFYSSMSVNTEVYISEAKPRTVLNTDYPEIYVIKIIPFIESQS